MEEIAKYSRTFKPTTLTFLLKSKIGMFTDKLKVKKLITLFGLPSSYEEFEIHYDDITSITTTKKLYKTRIIIGLLLIVLGLAIITDSLAISLIANLFGIYQLLNSYAAEIKIRQNYDKTTIIEIAVSELQYAEFFIEQLSTTMDNSGNLTGKPKSNN